MRKETWYAVIAAIAIGLLGYLIYAATLPDINNNDLPNETENDRNNFDKGDTYNNNEENIIE